MDVVGISHHGWDRADTSVGHEYLLTSNDQLLLANATHAPQPQSSVLVSSSSLAGPASTLVGSSTGLEINLIWDASIRNNANWAAIEAAVISAAQVYVKYFSTHVVLNVGVGFGEVGGSTMNPNALGESESYGYLTNYSTVQNAMQKADSGLVQSGLLSSDALTSNHPPTNANFFLTSAEAKALGLVNGFSTAIDGYIGIGSSSAIYFPANGGVIGKTQYDAVGIAAHELSEVMGRLGLEGGSLGSYQNVYTPLDLFRYQAAGVRDLTPTTGYFSTHDGAGGPTNLNSYNNPRNGGDATDWASASIGAPNAVLNDAYDAFGTPGVLTVLSSTDILEDAVLGYKLANGLPSSNIVA